jgi:replicative DNA helicase
MQDEAAERAVLGAVLLAPVMLDTCLEMGLSSEHFSQPKHGRIFGAFLALHQAGKPLDSVTLVGRLEDEGELERCGGFTYVAGLGSSVPSVVNAPHYVSIVIEKATVARMLLLFAQVENEAQQGASLDGLLDLAEGGVLALRPHSATGMELVGPIVEASYDTLRRRSENPGAVVGISTGFTDLDSILAGLQDTDLLILAARPSMGKTAFALNILAHAVLREERCAAFFSLEMSREQLGQRLLASEARVNGNRMRTGHLRMDDWGPLLSTAERFSSARLYIDDSAALTVQGVRARARRVPDLDLVVVDYLQLMRGNAQSREQEISSISRGLKALAKELHVPVLALSQLNRKVEERADKRPLMSDLRESGAIEQDADVILFLYREEVYHDDPTNKGVAQVLVRKQRNGATGDVDLLWRNDIVRFDNRAWRGD